MTNNEFARFLKDGKWDKLCSYISTEELSEEQQLMVLKQNDDISLQAELAKNRHVTPKAQLIIARRRDSEYDEARTNLANNYSCCEGAQVWLAKDPEEMVRRALAFNGKLCKKVAKKLLADESLEVLSSLYANLPLENWYEEIHENLEKNEKFMEYQKSEADEFFAAFAAEGT